MLNEKKIAFFSSAFPQNKNFSDDFFQSLNNQSHKNFDLILSNDGSKDLDEFTQKYPDLNTRIFNFTGDMNYIKFKTLTEVLKLDYDVIIFGDFDDYFTVNRVELINQYFQQSYEVLVHDVTLVDTKNKNILSPFFSKRLRNKSTITIDQIMQYNFLGFTNTAICTKLLKKLSLKEHDMIASDWYLFSQALLHNP